MYPYFGGFCDQILIKGRGSKILMINKGEGSNILIINKVERSNILINFGGFGEPSVKKHTCIHTHLISEGRKLRFRPGCPKCLKTLTETKVRDILFGPGRISRFLG